MKVLITKYHSLLTSSSFNLNIFFICFSDTVYVILLKYESAPNSHKIEVRLFCWIWGSHSSVGEKYSLQDCNDVYFGDS